MKVTSLETGVCNALDALLTDRLALLCGAGLSMAAPSSIPSAAELAERAKRKYDSTHGSERPPLPSSIEDQTQFFFERDELATVYLRTYIDHDAFAAPPNAGHLSIADLMLVRGIRIAVSTNVDKLIELAGNLLFGQIGVGVDFAGVTSLLPEKSPLLKIHGCWTDPSGTIWATGQIQREPTKTRIDECAKWLETRLADRDLLIVGYWTDWDYLNHVLDVSLRAVTPRRVIVVDPCDTASFESKAPALYDLGQRATADFCHVRSSGDVFLDELRMTFSRTFIRRILHSGKTAYSDCVGIQPVETWLEPPPGKADTLWRIRRDLEGCSPTEPAKKRQPDEEPLLGMFLLQLQARGARSEGSYWALDGDTIRVIRAANRPLHDVESMFSREMPPVVAPDFAVAVGAESFSLPASIARGSANGTVTRGPAAKWLSRGDAVKEFDL